MSPYAATERATAAAPAPFRVLVQSWRRHLLAANKAPRTIQSYTESLNQFASFLAERGMPTDPTLVAREHVESFVADLLGRHKPATAAKRYRSLQAFFRWLTEEGEIPASPMVKMRPPAIPEAPPDVLSEPELVRLLKACDGQAFEDRRDTAFVRLLIDTGMRRSELAGLKVEDVDFELNVALVLGKGRRPRSCPFGARTARALDRYLRARQAPRRRPAGAVARPRRPDDRQRPGPGAPEARRAGRHRQGPPAPAPAHLRPLVARQRRHRGRPDAPRRLAVAGDGESLRGVARRRAGARRP